MDSRPRRRTNIDGFYRIPNNKPLRYMDPRQLPSTRPAAATAQPVRRYADAASSSAYRRQSVPPKKRSFRNRHWSLKRKLVTSAIFILLIGFVGGTWYGARLLGSVDKVLHGNVFTDAHALFSQTKLKGEDQGRINILLAGDSPDDPGHGGALLTDSIMVLSFDTQHHTGFMLSIPRDLWVDIPGWSHQKINAANDVANFDQPGYAKGGMGQLEEIVQTDLGIPVDYYALINYTAFKDAVNAVGGITVTIQSPDPRGLYDPNISKADGGPLRLPNGPVNLNGQEALNLARARGDPCYCGHVEYGFPQSDYNRTQHQRQMLSALAQKSQSLGVITNPVKVSQLFNTLGNNVQTDVTLQDILRGMELTKGVNITNLQSLTYDESGPNALLTAYTDPRSGQEALIPKAGLYNFGQLQQFYQKLTSDSQVVKESPTVVLLNASDVTGLAHKEETALQSKGFDVVGVADANNQHPSTMVVDNSNGQMPASKKLLQQLYPGTIATGTDGSTEAAEAKGYTANFVVILGQNWGTAAQ